VLVALLIIRSAWSLIAKSWHVLMEGTPQGIDTWSLEKELVAAAPGVLGVHHVHLWSLTPERPLITLHANIAESTDHDAALHQLKHVLAERFGLSHATIQIERAACADDGPRQSSASRA
jgi:cobalt-zinc-cadmium efflux system protein